MKTIAPLPKLERTILDDIAAGEPVSSLNHVRRTDRRLRVDGKTRDIGFFYRAAKRGVRGASGWVRLETIIQSGCMVTTPSAVTRFIHRQAGPTPPAAVNAPATHETGDDTRAMHARLAALGL